MSGIFAKKFEEIFAKEFEDYIITGDRKYLESLVPNSKEERYIKLIESLTKESYTKELKQKINKFYDEYGQEAFRIKIMSLLKEYETIKKEDTESKEKVIEELCQVLDLNPPHTINKKQIYNIENNIKNDLEENEEYKSILEKAELESIESNVLYIINNLNESAEYKLRKFKDKKEFYECLYKMDITKENINIDNILKSIKTNDKFGKIILILFSKLSNEDFKLKIEELLNKEKSDSINKIYELLKEGSIHCFTLEKVEILINILKDNSISKDLCSYLLTRKYNEYISYEEKTNEEKRKIMSQIYNDFNIYNLKNIQTYSLLLLNMINLDIQSNTLNKDLFIEYISHQFSSTISIFNNISKVDHKAFKINLNILQNFNDNIKIKIIKKGIKCFLSADNAENIYTIFTKYFRPQFLNPIYEKIKFYNGKEVNTSILKEETISQLNKKIKLSICDYNKKHFEVNEDIKLYIKIKNIQTLIVKIYEINTENYYLTKMEEIPQNLVLDGIVPTNEETFNYSDKPQILSTKEICLSKIPKKRGVYIAELIGNGHSSRALIYKGYLTLIHKDTKDGKILYILDESNNICKGEQVGIWKNKTWYPCDIKGTGGVLIPYNKYENLKVILKVDDYAQLSENIEFTKKDIKLVADFIFNEQNLIINNICKCLIHAYLLSDKEYIPITELKKVNLKINLIKNENEEDIPIETALNDIKFEVGKDYEFEFRVPSKLKSIKFELTGQIKHNNLNDFEEVAVKKEYKDISELMIDNFFVKIIDGKYIVQYLGKNGEIKSNKQVKIEFIHKYLSSPFTYGGSILRFNTDNNGEINLGELADFSYFIIEQDKYNNKFKFYINQISNTTTTKDIILLENEEISIPVYNAKKALINLIEEYYPNTKQQLNLIERLKYDNLNNNYKIKTGVNNYDTVIISGLKKGFYNLKINNQIYYFMVLKGKEWNKGNFIITDNMIVDTLEYNNSFLYIKDINTENINKCILKIHSDQAYNPRVHISAYHYYNNKDWIKQYNNYYESLQTQKAILESQSLLDIFPIIKPNSKYLNKKILDEELQYVLDRKQYERYMGNALDKPSIVFNPQLMNDTETNIIEAKRGKDFEEPRLYGCCPDQLCAKRCLNDSNINCCEEGEYRDIVLNEPKGLKLYDFIKDCPVVLRNLKPNEKNEISFSLPKNIYNFIKVTLIDDIHIHEEIIALNKKDVTTNKKDLKMISTLKDNKNYCELRNINFINNKSKFVIKDFNSVKYQIFDSIEKYLVFFNLIIKDPKLKEEINKFKFLLNFDFLSLKEKFDKFSEFFSHEMNVFLYFHNESFFYEFVYPIIKYKSEKTFIDYFLLNDTQHIKEYTTPQKIKNLNTFEQCLLIYALRSTDPQMAKNICKNIQIFAEENKLNITTKKRLFNTALNVRLEKEEPAELIQEDNIGEEEAIVCESHEPKVYGTGRRYGMFGPRVKCCKRSMPTNSELFKVADDYKQERILKNKIFETTGKVKQYCETHYYNRIYSKTESKEYVKPNEFFADLAVYWSESKNIYKNKGFSSSNLLFIPNTLQELIFALSVIDLDCIRTESGQNFIQSGSTEITVEAVTNTYLLTKEISEIENDLNIKENDSQNNKKILIASIIKEYNPNALKQDENEDIEIELYLTGTIYQQEIIVTDITNQKVNCELLIQIPNGAVPLYDTEYTKIKSLNINSYSSIKIYQTFYFPNSGTFTQFPSIASMNGTIIGKSLVNTYNVSDTYIQQSEEKKSLQDILKQGKDSDIINYFSKCEYIKQQEIEEIAYKCQNLSFYNKLIDVLKKKLYFNYDIYSYSMTHGDLPTLKLFIQNKFFNEGTETHGNIKEGIKYLGPNYESIFFNIDESSSCKLNNHKDYYPVMNSRVHKLPKAKSTILTVQLRKTYQKYISYLLTLEKLNNINYIRLCYYLLLQQRIEDAEIVYNKIDTSKLENTNNSLLLQYDYISAYLDFSTGYPEFSKAREIVKKYNDFPLKEWKDMFNEIKAQLKEYDGLLKYDNFDEIIYNSEKAENSEKDLKQSNLTAKLVDKKIEVVYKGITKCDIKFYLIDIEILFSRKPFLETTANKFSYIKPNFINSFNINNKEGKLDINIPNDFINKNIFIEISSEKNKVNLTYYSSILHYTLNESIGEIKVYSPDMKALPKVYIKTFCKKDDNSVCFYKDGYTDLRGRFNYVLLNSDLIRNVKEFSILVDSKEYGTLIVKCKPPRIASQAEFSFENFNNFRSNMINQYAHI